MDIYCNPSVDSWENKVGDICFSQPKCLMEDVFEIPVSLKNKISKEVPFTFIAPMAKYIKGSLCGENVIVLLYEKTIDNISFYAFVESLYQLACNYALKIVPDIQTACPIRNNIQTTVNPISFKIKIPKKITHLPEHKIAIPLIHWKKILIIYGKIIMWCELIDEHVLSTRIQCMYRAWKAKEVIRSHRLS